MEVNLRTETTELDKALAALSQRLAHFRPVMDRIGRYLRRQTRLTFERGGRPKRWKPSHRAEREHGKTLMDTSRLAMSITHDAGDDEVVVGTNVAYGPIHQFGGEIRPKKAKALTIPISEIAKGKRAREFADLFILKREGKAPLLVRRRGSDRIEPMYVLMKKVTLPPRPFLVWLPEFDKEILRQLSGWVEQ